MAAHQGPYGPSASDDGAWAFPWFVVQTEPQSEFQALNRVSKLPGVKPWLILEVRRRFVRHYGRAVFIGHVRQREEVLRPFFLGYLLVSFDPNGEAFAPLLRWNRELRTKCLLCDDNFRPLPLPDGTVADLQRQGRAGDGAIDLQTIPATLTVGDKVTVLDGPFADRRTIIEWTDQKRVEVLMGQLRVSLDRSQVG